MSRDGSGKAGLTIGSYHHPKLLSRKEARLWLAVRLTFAARHRCGPMTGNSVAFLSSEHIIALSTKSPDTKFEVQILLLLPGSARPLLETEFDFRYNSWRLTKEEVRWVSERKISAKSRRSLMGLSGAGFPQDRPPKEEAEEDL